ncbi:MAG: hypothetical protein ACF8R7_04085, partial [Phycisphaerales bacterium JB039]
ARGAGAAAPAISATVSRARRPSPASGTRTLTPGGATSGAAGRAAPSSPAEASTAPLAPRREIQLAERALLASPGAPDAAPAGASASAPALEAPRLAPALAVRTPGAAAPARAGEAQDAAQHQVSAATTEALRAGAPALPPAQADATIVVAEPAQHGATEQALAAPALAADIDRAGPPAAIGVLPLPGAAALELRLPEAAAPAGALYEQRDERAREALVEQGGGSEQTEAAVAAALDWLARHQEDSGAWNGRTFDRHGVGGRATYDFESALTGLALLCFLGADHTHAQAGPYQDNVRRAIDWLLEAQEPDGDLRTGSTMYNHGIAAIALCEAYGMTQDPRLRDPAQQALRFIEGAQGRRGGWRYDPQQAGDTSVLGWQVMALVSGKRAGLEVSDEALGSASAWLDSASRRSSPGLYAYQARMAPTVSMTAEGMFTRQLLGEDAGSDRMIESAAFISRQPPRWESDQTTYAWYYATMALYQHGGETWERWNAQLAPELLERQRQDGHAAGSWDPRDRWSRIGGRIYQTAICALTLEVYYRYLPQYMEP